MTPALVLLALGFLVLLIGIVALWRAEPPERSEKPRSYDEFFGGGDGGGAP